MKRIVSIQDISCVGKCSLTVALPILSAMGLETAVLPTAVLSAHTAFEGFTFHDLTGEMRPIMQHWESQGLTFDAVYSGYLGSFAQLQLVSEFLDRFHQQRQLVLIDPVMADHGRLYPGFTPDFPSAMARLCARADVIVPNLTEAAFLLGRPYRESYSRWELEELLQALCGLGARQTVLTGVSLSPGELGVMAYDREQDRFFTYFQTRQPASFHGTGDIFASAVAGGLLNGLPLEKALPLAVDYTAECIRLTVQDPQRRWYGVQFEGAIPFLLRRLSAALAADGAP